MLVKLVLVVFVMRLVDLFNLSFAYRGASVFSFMFLWISLIVLLYGR